MPAILEPPSAPLHDLKPYKSLSNEDLSARIEAVRRELGPKLWILGPHCQQDEVIANSDLRAALEWSLKRTKRVFFFPDQHLGRNTALKMGITNDQMPVFDPYNSDLGGNSEEAIKNSRVILWKGHCSVHQMFRAEHVKL